MNNNWEYKKIGDICIVERGGSPRPIKQIVDRMIGNGEFNWITTAEILRNQ